MHRNTSIEALAKKYGIDERTVKERISQTTEKLFAEREKRMRPSTDDKCLLSWNALMNKALCKAYIAIGQEAYKEEAIKHLEWMLNDFYDGEKLMHAWKNNNAYLEANLDDYAYLIDALLTAGSIIVEVKY